MNAATPLTVPPGNDVLSIGVSITPLFKSGAFTARATLTTSHYRAGDDGSVLTWPDGTAMKVGPDAIESHNDVFADAAGNGTTDPGQATLAAAIQAAVNAYMASPSPAFPGQTIQQVYAASVITIQTALSIYCAAAGK